VTVRSSRRNADRSDDIEEEPAMTEHERDVQHHPVIVAHRARTAASVQLRIADAITALTTDIHNRLVAQP
jgi:hypothetical protein